MMYKVKGATREVSCHQQRSSSQETEATLKQILRMLSFSETKQRALTPEEHSPHAVMSSIQL